MWRFLFLSFKDFHIHRCILQMSMSQFHQSCQDSLFRNIWDSVINLKSKSYLHSNLWKSPLKFPGRKNQNQWEHFCGCFQKILAEFGEISKRPWNPVCWSLLMWCGLEDLEYWQFSWSCSKIQRQWCWRCWPRVSCHLEDRCQLHQQMETLWLYFCQELEHCHCMLHLWIM